MSTRGIGGARLALHALFALIVVLVAAGSASAKQSCESLTGLKLAGITIDKAYIVPAGTNPNEDFTAGRGGALLQPRAPAYATLPPATTPPNLPEFCRVEGTMTPTKDSSIKFEVWLPTTTWNGKFENPGNGGLGGHIFYAYLEDGLLQGYAEAQTDTGHATPAAPADASGNWAIGQPEKVIDFAYRAEHLTTVNAKLIVAAFYGKPAKYAYWNGCSRGGGEALTELQRYPDDYNGIIDGADGGATVQHHAGHIWSAQALTKDPAAAIPASKLPAITKSLMDECDALDGVKDGILGDPRACHWNPEKMLCKGADGPDCLTAPQAKALNQIYDGAKNDKGETVTYGYPRGTEASFVTQPDNGRGGASAQGAFGGAAFFKGFVFEDPNWDWHTLDFTKDLEYAQKKVGALVNNINPDISAFRKHGGKLISFNGWSDTGSTANELVAYYESVQKKMGNTDSFYRLFLLPGMGHCGGGAGPSMWNPLQVLSDWVENGKAPEQFIASKPGMTRPICMYPKVAKYKGSGSTDDATNFACAAP